MPEEQIPPVVAVVVAHDPGTWFEECLGSILAQDYPNLVVLVVDAASAEPVAPRVALVAPSAYLQRLDENLGFGPSINAVLGLVEGAAYYLACHDDVILAPDALRRMVEESFRSNSAIVGPKLVDIEEPDLILQFGLGVDRLGAPVRRVLHREFDQAQHDETRDVFAVPGAATLIRADLLTSLGGFDPQISMFGEDVDLCWRAHLAGARVVVTPFAQVRHREATASRQRELPDARALQWRHELRAVLKNYQGLHRFVRASELVVLSLLEATYFVVVGHRRRAREVIGAWRWNFAKEQRLRQHRVALKQVRRVSDHEVSELMSSRTSRMIRFFGPGLEQLSRRWSTNREVFANWQDDHRGRGGDLRPRWVTNTVWVAAVVLVLGGRSLIASHLPLIGQYLPLPTTTALIGHFFAGSTSAGTQALGPVTPASLWLGLSGFVLFGAMGVLVKVGLLICIVLGGLGMVRLVRPFGPPTARCAAVLAYLYLPLAWNDLARANIGALIAYGVTPYLLARLMRASGQAPFVLHSLPIRSKETVGEMLSLGILLTLTAAFEPALIIMVPLMALGLTVGTAVLARRAVELRTLSVALGASVLCLVALFPWSLTFVQPGANFGVLTGAATDAAHAPQLGQLFRLQVGPYGSGIFSWGLLAGAVYVLFAGRSVRFAWAVRLWSLGLFTVFFTWLGGQGWLGQGWGASGVFIAPFAVVIALLVGLGVTTVLEDLRGSTFGLRHLATALFVVVSVLGFLPVLGATLNGRFDTPATGYDTLLSWISSGVSVKHSSTTTINSGLTKTHRVLWLGNPSALPLTSWQISPGLAFGVSDGGLPSAPSIWPSTHEGNATSIKSAIVTAEAGSTVRLGSLLGANDISYLIVPTAVAPVVLGTQSEDVAPAPRILLDALANQDDLHQLPSEGGALIFAITEHPNSPISSSGLPSFVHLIAILVEFAIWFILCRIGLRERRIRQTKRRHERAEQDAPSPPLDDQSIPESEVLS
jgi:GT2 family glycosyltransferase